MYIGTEVGGEGSVVKEALVYGTWVLAMILSSCSDSDGAHGLRIFFTGYVEYMS